MNKQDSYESAAANLQIEYDMAVHYFGVNSQQAKDAELAVKEFFAGLTKEHYENVQSGLAQRYGVAFQTISKIINNRSWI